MLKNSWRFKVGVIALGLALIGVAWSDLADAAPPAGAQVLSCKAGTPAVSIAKPGAAVSMNVSPNASGSPSLCGLPGGYPAAYFVKTTVDGGKSWQWTYHLSDFGFSAPVPPSTPPPAACPDTFIMLNWNCSLANGVATCTAKIAN